MVTALLLKMSAPCSNALHCPFPHVQHCPPHHGRVNLRNLPDNVGLQLVEGGRTRAINLGFEVAPKWQMLDMDGTWNMEDHSKFMEELFIFMEGHSKVIRQFERLKRVDNKVLELTIKTVFYILTHLSKI